MFRRFWISEELKCTMYGYLDSREPSLEFLYLYDGKMRDVQEVTFLDFKPLLGFSRFCCGSRIAYCKTLLEIELL